MADCVQQWLPAAVDLGNEWDETLNETHDRQSSIQILQKLKAIFRKGLKRVVNQSNHDFYKMISKTAH